MIDNNQTTNVKLTLEQLQQIDVVEQKLAGLNTQVNVATKNLKVVTNDTNRFAREIEAQKPVLESLNAQVALKQKDLELLQADIVEKTAMLNELLSQFKEHTDLMASEKASHDEREAQIATKEFDLSSKESKLTKIAIGLDSENLDFNNKVANLKEVISKF